MYTEVSREENLPENRFRAIITNGSRDRYGTSFDPQGAITRGYMANPVVLWRHKNEEVPIGHSISLTLTSEGQWISDFEIDGATEFERVLIAKLNSGSLNAVSIGARINPNEVEYDEDTDTYHFREWELYEFSVVPIGGNPEAVIVGREFSEEESESSYLEEYNRLIRDHCEQRGIPMEDAEDKEALEALEAHDEHQEPTEERAGRVLSRSNEKKLREAAEMILEVLKAADKEEEEEEDEDEDEDEDEERTVFFNREEMDGASNTTRRSYLDQLLYELEHRDIEESDSFGLDIDLTDFEF